MASRDDGDGEEGRHARDDIAHHVDTFLGEFRMVIPALGALFGFQLTAAFQQSYPDLPVVDRAANFAGVACSAVAFLFLLVPASYHRFIAKQEETAEFLRFARTCIAVAFAFLPVALSLALYLQAVRSFHSHAVAVAVGAAFLLLFVVGWWVVPPMRAKAAGKKPLEKV